MKDSLVVASCLALCIIFATTSIVGAQEDFQKDLADSALSDAGEKMGDLVKLVVVNGRLGMLRNWEKEEARERIDEKKDDRFEKEVDKLIERGLPEEHARRMAKHRLAMVSQSKSVCAKRVGEIVEAVSGSRSGGGASSRGEDEWECRFRSTSLRADATGYGEKRTFSFVTRDGIELSFEDDRKEFKLRLFSDSGIFYVHQNLKRIQWVTIRGDDAKVYVAESYYKLCEKYPEAVEADLHAVLMAIGINPPMTLDDEEVVSVALEVLQAQQDDWMKVQGLLDGMQSDSLSEREDSYQELLKGYYKWYGLIDQFKSELSLDEMAKPKFEKVLTAAPGTSVNDYVMLLDLLNNKKELLRLLKVVPEKEATPILSQLRKLTGKSLGYDIEGWKKIVASDVGKKE